MNASVLNKGKYQKAQKGGKLRKQPKRKNSQRGQENANFNSKNKAVLMNDVLPQEDISSVNKHTQPDQENANCNSKNKTVLLKDVLPQGDTSCLNKETRSEEDNNEQICKDYLAEELEIFLPYEIQQLKKGRSSWKANLPLPSIQKSNRPRLLSNQPLLHNNDWLYKKYLDEEFATLVPYEDEQTSPNTSTVKTNVLYSLPARKSSKLRLLLNQPSTDEDNLQRIVRIDPPMAVPFYEMDFLDFVDSY